MRTDVIIRAHASPTEGFFLTASGSPTKARQPDKIPAMVRLVAAPQFPSVQASADVSKPFTMVAYTGAALRLPNFPYPVVVDCAGLTCDSQRIPILKDHDQKQIVGHSEKITINPTGLVVINGRISGTGPAADEVRKLAGRKFPWQTSIGAPVQEMEFIDEGETTVVNGRQFQGPVYVARKATLRETSFVALGADGGTSATVAASASTASKGATMSFEEWVTSLGLDPAKISEEQRTSLQIAYDALNPAPTPPPPIKAAAKSFEEWVTSLGLDPAKISEEQRTSLQIAYDALNPAPTPPPTPTVSATAIATTVAREIRRAQATENQRVIAIRRHCAGLPDIEAKAIAEGWTAQQAELEALRAGRPSAFSPSTRGGSAAAVNTADCIEASLCLAAGMQQARVGQWFDQKVMNEAVGKKFQRFTIGTLLHEVIRAAGMHARPGAIDDNTIRTALRADRQIRAGMIQAAGFTSLSMSGILSNVANKAMIASYEAQEIVWDKFCAIRNHADFKVHTRYRLDSQGSLRKVGPDGELKHISMSEASYTNQLDTYGAIIALTRQMQINDDLGAFLELPTVLGQLAALRPEEAFFVLLLANTGNFFHTNNKNIVTGTGGAMTAANAIAAITAAEDKFSQQVNSNGKPIAIPPNRILTGTANYNAARAVYVGQNLITGANETRPQNDEVFTRYQPFRSPYLNNTAITDEDGAAISGQSSTLWYLFADPARMAAFGMAFLNGNRVPTIESDDTEFSTLGMQWRCYFDFGVGQEDPKAAVKVNGA